MWHQLLLIRGAVILPARPDFRSAVTVEGDQAVLSEIMKIVISAPACRRPLLTSHGRQVCLDVATVPPLLLGRSKKQRSPDSMVPTVWVRISSASQDTDDTGRSVYEQHSVPRTLVVKDLRLSTVCEFHVRVRLYSTLVRHPRQVVKVL